MRLMVLRNLWGVVEPWEESFPRMKGAGYDGIELELPENENQRRLHERLEQFEFSYVAQIRPKGSGVMEQVNSFKRLMVEVKNLRPQCVVCIGGRDVWGDSDMDRYLAQVLQIEEAVGIPVAHATHRGTVLNNPWTTDHMIDRHPDLKLCCDFSHWVLVAERLLPDMEGTIRKAAKRCIHIHGRVGYEAGPQVSDPRAFEYSRHVAAFERWWTWVWEDQSNRHLEVSSFTPAYGPPPYMHTLPHTNLPVASLSEICDWQAERAREMFERMFGEGSASQA